MLPNKKYTPADIINIVRLRWALVVVPPVVALFGALVISSRLPNVYQAETLIQIVPQRVPDRYITSTVTLKTEDRLDAIGQQVTSRTQLERIIRDLNLFPRERELQPMQDMVERMRLSVKVELVRPMRNAPPDAFYLRFQYGDPAVATKVVERLSTLYIDQNARERGQLAEAARDFLKSQLDQATLRLDEQDRKLQQFRERHAGKLPTQLAANMQAVQSYQMQRQALVESLARDRDLRLTRQRMLDDTTAAPMPISPGAPAGTVTDASALSTMPPKQRLEVARTALQRLEGRLTESHPDLRRAREQVADLEKQVAAEAGSGTAASAPSGVTPEELSRRDRISAMRAEIESLDRQIAHKETEERRLSGVLEDYQGKINAVPGVESEWIALSRDYNTLSEAFNDLLRKSESANAAVELERRQVGEQFEVVEAPRAAGRPVSPDRQFISSVGFGSGLAIGLLLIGFLEIRDSSLKTEKEVQEVLGLPVIAVVPHVVTSAERVRLRWRRTLVSSVAFASIAICGYVVWALKLWEFVA